MRGLLVFLIVGVCGLYAQQAERLFGLPYGECNDCIAMNLHEGAGVGWFAVNPSGTRFYLRDGEGRIHILDRTGKPIARFTSPVPVGIAGVADDGSIVVVGECQPISRRDKESIPRPIWVIEPNGSIDEKRTEGFNRALERFRTEQNRGADCFPMIAFLTQNRLGLLVSAPVSFSADGEARLDQQTGLLILKADGSWEGLYPAIAASKRGSILEDPRLRSLEAQQEWIRRTLNPQTQASYKIVDETGDEYKRDRAPVYPAEMQAQHVSLGGTRLASYTLQIGKAGVLLIEPGARMDERGRLYLPGAKTERALRPLRLNQSDELELLDGYVVARFLPDGRFEGIVAEIAIPTYHCHPRQLWDIDSVGNLYFLKFTETGVEVWMVPAPASK
ncbi:MAG: hypothetical protein K6U12_05190 [Armatimonadetes bacterium]|nr:hypothetical protein [Armatimonadota bacterium]CUU38363.1 hypothetical protein DCOP10_12567 [Armatimonadetes bacterium DC]